jgi:hypothetical protein
MPFLTRKKQTVIGTAIITNSSASFRHSLTFSLDKLNPRYHVGMGWPGETQRNSSFTILSAFLPVRFSHRMMNKELSFILYYI